VRDVERWNFARYEFLPWWEVIEKERVSLPVKSEESHYHSSFKHFRSSMFHSDRPQNPRKLTLEDRYSQNHRGISPDNLSRRTSIQTSYLSVQSNTHTPYILPLKKKIDSERCGAMESCKIRIVAMMFCRANRDWKECFLTCKKCNKVTTIRHSNISDHSIHSDRPQNPPK
jgi:hypothetical protein